MKLTKRQENILNEVRNHGRYMIDLRVKKDLEAAEVLIAENLVKEDHRQCGWLKMTKVIPAPEVGMAATLHFYSDSDPMTIIKVTPKTITMQEDNAELLNPEDLKFHVGGFSAHCSNQHAQEYKYTRNPNGAIRKATLRKNGEWIQQGCRLNRRGGSVTIGTRYKFYDYNF